ncbi:MAG: hypothetical protein KAQ67_11735 [Gammaproteobacteria bacterium]|nr:hypothetical protein [Gammaproteobacteria bacterium]
MDWIQITSVLFLVAMAVFLFPRVKHAVANSPKAEKGDWMSIILPIAAVIGFVILLIMMVQ